MGKQETKRGRKKRYCSKSDSHSATMAWDTYDAILQSRPAPRALQEMDIKVN